MSKHGITLRNFLRITGGTLGVGITAGLPLPVYATGKRVEPMALLTSNASFDPVRPEMGRLIAQACKGIGWAVKLAAEDYNLGITKVFKEQDFDMFIVRWTGRANRIDPETFIYMQHHRDGAYNKWGYNNPKVNQLAEAQEVAMDPNVRQELVYEAQQVLFDDVARKPDRLPQHDQRLPGGSPAGAGADGW